jgi:hypothetical protein
MWPVTTEQKKGGVGKLAKFRIGTDCWFGCKSQTPVAAAARQRRPRQVAAPLFRVFFVCQHVTNTSDSVNFLTIDAQKNLVCATPPWNTVRVWEQRLMDPEMQSGIRTGIPTQVEHALKEVPGSVSFRSHQALCLSDCLHIMTHVRTL